MIKYHFDEMDLEFIMNIQDILESDFPNHASEILIKSSFLKRLKDEPTYVYHYDEQYWAEIIRTEFKSKEQILI